MVEGFQWPMTRRWIFYTLLEVIELLNGARRGLGLLIHIFDINHPRLQIEGLINGYKPNDERKR